MIEWIANKTVEWLQHRNVVDETNKDIYIYGANLIIYTFLSTVGLLLIGMLFHRFWETVIIIGLFYTNQTVGGGYHASTHLSCFITMAVGLVIVLITYMFSIPSGVWFGCLFLSVLILEIIPLVLHPHKAYLKKNRAKLVARSRVITAIEGCIAITSILMGWGSYAYACCLGMIASAVSRFYAVCSATDV